MPDADARGAAGPAVGPPDAELVQAACTGDKAAFATIYDRYADRVHAFCLSVLRNPDDAADVTQDTFVVAARRLDQLRDPTRLRSWLFAVARHEAFRRSKQRSRQVAVDEMDDQVSLDAGPEDTVSRQDAASIVHEAAAGLTEKDRAILDLSLRHGLEGEELGAALGVSGNHASVVAGRVRDRVERSLGALLVARLGQDDCTDLQEVLAGWDGRFDPLVRKRVARHVDGCAVCAATKRRLASPAALLSAVPIVSAPSVLRSRVLEAFDVQAASAGTLDGPGQPDSDVGAQPDSDAGGQAAAPVPAVAVLPDIRLRRDGFPRSSARRPVVLAVAAAVLLLVVLVGALVALPSDGEPETVASVAAEQGLERGLSLGTEIPEDPDADGAPAGDGGAVATPDDPAGAPQEDEPDLGSGPTGGGGPVVTVPPAPPPTPPPDTTGPAVSASPGNSTIRGQGCGVPTTTTINATASDPSGISSVYLSPYGGAMSGGGSSWSRSIGPFVPMGPGATTITFTVTATDGAGNSSSTNTQVIVVGC
jgi:RNA polymerase sigma factor (sigma-70 family)